MKPMKASQNRNGAARILAKIDMDFKSPLTLKPPFFSTLAREFYYAVAKNRDLFIRSLPSFSSLFPAGTLPALLFLGSLLKRQTSSLCILHEHLKGLLIAYNNSKSLMPNR